MSDRWYVTCSADEVDGPHFTREDAQRTADALANYPCGPHEIERRKGRA